MSSFKFFPTPPPPIGGVQWTQEAIQWRKAIRPGDKTSRVRPLLFLSLPPHTTPDTELGRVGAAAVQQVASQLGSIGGCMDPDKTRNEKK